MEKHYKVVFVEDEPDLVYLFSSALEKAGFCVDTVSDGGEAFAAIKKINPNMVLLDLVIPNKDGYEVLNEIKKDKNTKDIDVYVFSNLTQSSEIQKAIKLGAKDFLIKSDYTPNQLVDKIKKYFSSKK